MTPSPKWEPPAELWALLRDDIVAIVRDARYARTLLPEAIEEIKRLEAKLAVAVEALEDAINRMEEDRAALAEIKGEK